MSSENLDGHVIEPDDPVLLDVVLFTEEVENPPGDAIVIEPESEVTPLNLQDRMLNYSRIAPGGPGNVSGQEYLGPPTSSQKWWAALILGLLFFVISSPLAYYLSSTVTTTLGGLPTTIDYGPTLIGLIIHTLLFILLVRLLMW